MIKTQTGSKLLKKWFGRELRAIIKCLIATFRNGPPGVFRDNFVMVCAISTAGSKYVFVIVATDVTAVIVHVSGFESDKNVSTAGSASVFKKNGVKCVILVDRIFPGPGNGGTAAVDGINGLRLTWCTVGEYGEGIIG